jgi:uncharacterized protein (TIGR03435 family)
MVKKLSGAFFVGAVLMAGVASAQPADAAKGAQSHPAFEVAAVKPSAQLTPQSLVSGQVRLGVNVTGARVDIDYLSLADLIRTAYDVKGFQVSGPDWMSTERFDIAAKLPDGATKDDVNAMLQTLLAERFGLVVHREKRDHQVYALIVGRDGPKMQPGEPDVAAPPQDDAPPPVLSANGQSLSALKQTSDGFSATVTGKTGPTKISMTAAGEHIEALRITMPVFADTLTPMMDRPVVDQTGLTGTYHVALDIPMQELMVIAQRAAASMGISMANAAAAAGAAAAVGNARAGGGGVAAAADPGGGVSIFESVQKLGLKLDPRSEPVDVVVVDHVEKTPKEDQ